MLDKAIDKIRGRKTFERLPTDVTREEEEALAELDSMIEHYEKNPARSRRPLFARRGRKKEVHFFIFINVWGIKKLMSQDVTSFFSTSHTVKLALAVLLLLLLTLLLL